MTARLHALLNKNTNTKRQEKQHGKCSKRIHAHFGFSGKFLNKLITNYQINTGSFFFLWLKSMLTLNCKTEADTKWNAFPTVTMIIDTLSQFVSRLTFGTRWPFFLLSSFVVRVRKKHFDFVFFSLLCCKNRLLSPKIHTIANCKTLKINDTSKQWISTFCYCLSTIENLIERNTLSFCFCFWKGNFNEHRWKLKKSFIQFSRS